MYSSHLAPHMHTLQNSAKRGEQWVCCWWDQIVWNSKRNQPTLITLSNCFWATETSPAHNFWRKSRCCCLEVPFRQNRFPKFSIETGCPKPSSQNPKPNMQHPKRKKTTNRNPKGKHNNKQNQTNYVQSSIPKCKSQHPQPDTRTHKPEMKQIRRAK